MKIHSALLLLTLFGLSLTASAQWQWLDKDGHKVFSDRAPPPDIAEKSILKRPNSPTQVAPTGDGANIAAAMPAPAASQPVGSGVDKDLEAKKKQAAEAEAAKRKAEEERVAKAKIENCANAKQAKATLDSGIRIKHINASGEAEVLDDAGRAAEQKRIQSTIDSNCR